MTARILIADGHATNRIMLKVRLTAACYDVEAAAGTRDLMSRLATRRPDLILIGGDLPDGPAAICAALRAAEGAAAIPVLALCARADRLAVMRAGASAVLDPDADELMLLARLRGLLRETAQLAPGFAEPAPSFAGPVAAGGDTPGRLPLVTLVGDSPARALAWKHALSRRLPYRIAVRDAEQTLAEAAAGAAADLYLIAADLDSPGEGLRLLSELRSRPASQAAAFIIAVPDARPELAAIALDLGAGETVSPDLADPALIELAGIAITDQIARKALADRRRAEARQSLIWSITDPLTGLPNRRYALPRLAETLAAARRRGAGGGGGGGCAVLSIDADHFKRINDRFGHAAGDAVLVALARRIETVVAGRGLAARMGGEEFMVILPGCDDSAAAACAEAIAEATAAAPVPLPALCGGGAVGITVSIGIAMLESGDMALPAGADLSALLLHRADRGLQIAKAAGRNRIVFAPMHEAA